jgi:hypothetical protein
MNAQEHPTSFGVYKPVGHVVLSFPSGDDLTDASQALVVQGGQAERFTSYEPAEMLAQSEADLAHATGLASAGYEVSLARIHKVLAEHGYHFLVVPADNRDAARRIVDAVRPFRAGAAQYYGTFVIEDLIEPPSELFDEEATAGDGLRGGSSLS